jgi:hypothetical protein
MRADDRVKILYSVDVRSLRFTKVNGELFREIYPFEVMYTGYPLMVDRLTFELLYNLRSKRHN